MTSTSGIWARTLGALAAAALLLAAARVQYARETRYPPAVIDDDSLYLTSGTTVHRFSVGYDALAADLYWIRTIQYFGATTRRLQQEVKQGRRPRPDDAEFRSLYPLLDITTTLDPEFNIAYRFGSIFLMEKFPGGAGRPDLAIKLLQKGLGERPDKWEYMQDIGFVYYWSLHDFRSAAAWFARAAAVPDAPWFMKSLAATTLAAGGSRESSKTMWEAIRQSADNDWLRRDAEWRLQQLRALDDIDALQRAVDRIVAATGRPPADWSEVLHRRGVVPADPTGVPYVLADDRVQLSFRSTLNPLPDEKLVPPGPPQ